MLRKNILIISTRKDVEADAIEEILITRGGRVWRLPVEDFFRSVPLSVEYGGRPAVLRFPQGELVMDSVRAVLFRRHAFELLPQTPRNDIEMFAQLELEAAFRGMVDLLSEAQWVNNPFNLYALEPRLAQFARAAEAGFALPRTLVTNDVERAREFQAKCEAGAAVEQLSGEVQQSDFVEGGRIPFCLRERIANGMRLRLHVVGDQVFGDGVPAVIQEQALLFARQCGLLFAAIDFIRTVTGQFLFLGCNARPAWLNEQQSRRIAITNALAELLDRAPVRMAN